MLKPSATLLLLCLTSPTLMAGNLFDQLDRDHNGSISHDEAQAVPEIAGQWIKLDKNNDEGVDKHEFAAFKAMNFTITRLWFPY